MTLKMKVLLIGVTIISILFLTQKVTSFSEAVIKSDTSIKITDQEHALISILSNEVEKVIQGTASELTVNISNRVSGHIQLEAGAHTIDGMTFSYDSSSFSSKNGDYQPLTINVETNEQKQKLGQTQEYKIPLHFKWETGEATIPAEVKIDTQDIGGEEREKE